MEPEGSSGGATLPPQTESGGVTAPAPPPSRTGLVDPAPLPHVPGFEVESVLGRGAMGVVLRARDTKLARTVALKMILAGDTAGAEERARFAIEAQAVARLTHPNVVQIYEIGEHEGRPYLALEFAGGGTLAHLLAGQPQPPREAARMLEVLARAVHAAHVKGVVHRDLKPANVLLDDAGALKVSDFGLAKRLDVEDGRTRTGAIMGTPSYMAPEQAEGKIDRIAPATDVYALGAILYEMLTGRPPLRGTTALETLLMVRRQEPLPPGRLQPGVPRDLDTIAMKCLEKDPRARYAGADELADEVARFLAGEPIRARPAGALERAAKWAARNRTVAWLGAALALSLAGGATFGAVQLMRATQAALERAEAERTGREQTEKQRAIAEVQRTIAEDQRKRAEAGERRANQKLAATRALTGQQRARAGDATAAAVYYADAFAVDPDPRYFADATAMMDRAASLDAVVGEGVAAKTAALSPSGRVALAAADGRVTILDAASRQTVAVVAAGELEEVLLSPDGKRLVTRAHARAQLWDATTGRELGELGELGYRPFLAAFAPDASRLYVFAGAEDFRGFSEPSLTPHGADGSQIEGPAMHPRSKAVRVAISEDGRRLAQVNLSGYVELWDLAARKPVGAQVIDDDAKVRALAFTRDGAALAGAAEDGTLRAWDAATGREKAPPLACGGELTALALSADGARAVVGARSGAVQVWDLVARKPLGPPAQHLNEVTDIVLSPNGQLAASASQDRTVRWVDVESGGPAGTVLRQPGPVTRLAFERARGRLLVWSPGGPVRAWAPPARVAPRTYRSERGPLLALGGRVFVVEPERGTLEIIDAERGGRIGGRLAHGGPLTDLEVSPDGTRIAAAGQDGAVRVWSAADARLAFRIACGEEVRDVAFSGDGRRLATAAGLVARVWDGLTGVPRSAVLTHEHGVVRLELDRTGERLDAVELVERVSHQLPKHAETLWDVASGRALKRKADGPDFGTSLLPGTEEAMKLPPEAEKLDGYPTWGTSPGGRWTYAAFSSGAVRLWDRATLRPAGRAIHHGTSRLALDFGPRDRWLATAGDDRTVRLWDCASGEPLELAVPHDEDLLGVHFVGAGRRLLAYGPSSVQLVAVDALARQPDAGALAAEVRRRTGHVLDEQDEVAAMPAR